VPSKRTGAYKEEKKHEKDGLKGVRIKTKKTPQRKGEGNQKSKSVGDVEGRPSRDTAKKGKLQWEVGNNHRG